MNLKLPLRLSPGEFALALRAGLIEYSIPPGHGVRVGGEYVGRAPLPLLAGAPVAFA